MLKGTAVQGSGGPVKLGVIEAESPYGLATRVADTAESFSCIGT
jgi:hypothetical protein